MDRVAFFVNLIKKHGIGRVAEIGTLRGDFAKGLLRAECIETLYCIDNWDTPGHKDAREQAYALANQSNGRMKIIEKPSIEAAKDFAPLSIGLVYLDALHSYPAVREDLRVWWPKTRRFISGHDYVLWNACANFINGVVPAVEEFAFMNGLDVWIDGELLPAHERLIMAYQAITKPSFAAIPSWVCERPQI